MDIMISIILIILSYLYGSIPFALVIGRLVYKTDVRNYGSGNLGGTNTGRVLGKKSWCCCNSFGCFKGIISNAFN